MDVRDAEEYYRRIGCSRRIGLGERPALLIVDCNHGCADPTVSPIGIAMEAEIGHIRRRRARAFSELLARAEAPR